jgi:hypothetical protein
MIKIMNAQVFNLEGALRGMRNPMNSWDKSDSVEIDVDDFYIGPEDLKLARSLVKAGSDERKFLRQIFVSMDILAPLYWWKEFDTYKVGTVANSTSTMHKIHAKPFARDDFSHERMTPWVLECLDNIIDVLEVRRQDYMESKDKAAWEDMIQLLPSSYNQLRTVTLNFENLLNQYNARKNHKLLEWRAYCSELRVLPYFYDLCLNE